MDANNRNHWFLDPGPLSSWIDQFAADLAAQRYTPLTIEGYTASARHFAAWLGSAGISIDVIDDDVVRRFAEHRCRCPGGRQWFAYLTKIFAPRREVGCFPAKGRCRTSTLEGRVAISLACRLSELIARPPGTIGTNDRPSPSPTA